MPKKAKNTARVASPNSLNYLRARPWLRRQLGEDPSMALFWRDGPVGSRQGMLWVLSGCRHPQCTCTEVLIQALSVPDSLVSVQLKDSSIQQSLVPDPKGLAGPFVKRVASATVNIATGAITKEGEERSDPELLAWLKAELDADVITMLRVAWNIGKGRAPDTAITG